MTDKHFDKELFHTDRKEYPVTRQISGYTHQLLYPFAARYGEDVRIILPGFIFDGFSVPRILWWLQPPMTGAGTPAALVHDAGYGDKNKTKSFEDTLFHNMLLKYGVSYFKADILFTGVFIGGHWAWYKGKGDNENVFNLKVWDTGRIEELLNTDPVVI